MRNTEDSGKMPHLWEDNIKQHVTEYKKWTGFGLFRITAMADFFEHMIYFRNT